VLILGIGNVLWADEGFGIRCVDAMPETHVLPDSVKLLDGRTQGLYLLPFLDGIDALLVFNAIDYGLPPGTMKLVRNGKVLAYMRSKKVRLHQTGFQDVIAKSPLTGVCPPEMALIDCQPVELEDFGGSLLWLVADRIPEACRIGDARFFPGGARMTRAALSSVRKYPRPRPPEPVARPLREEARQKVAPMALDLQVAPTHAASGGWADVRRHPPAPDRHRGHPRPRSRRRPGRPVAGAKGPAWRLGAELPRDRPCHPARGGGAEDPRGAARPRLADARGPLGQAFANLDARPPQLPPHLPAALDAGLAKG
jgi:hydrogenase maturation protease